MRAWDGQSMQPQPQQGGRKGMQQHEQEHHFLTSSLPYFPKNVVPLQDDNNG